MAPLILLVDDFEDARDIYSTYLRFRGYRVTVAGSGADAIALAQTERPDLVLLDVRMPSMTGTEAMRVLRRDPRFRDVPIVALTALAMEDERIEALAAGFDAVIPKPCLPDDLLAAIARLLGESPPPASVP
jgi:CheY-like chemotaxis protein